jgi:hypothetical protein
VTPLNIPKTPTTAVTNTNVARTVDTSIPETIVKDYGWDRWYKTITDTQNKSWSTKKIVGAREGRYKTVTKEIDEDGNVTNVTKTKSDRESLKYNGEAIKYKSDHQDLRIADVAVWSTVEASSEDIKKALSNISQKFQWYKIVRNWAEVKITRKDGWGQIAETAFMDTFKWALAEAGITNLDMRGYKFKCELENKTSMVNKLTFTVWPDTKKKSNTIATQKPTIDAKAYPHQEDRNIAAALWLQPKIYTEKEKMT